MVQRATQVQQVQEQHDNGTLLKEFPFVDNFCFNTVYVTPSIGASSNFDLDIDVIECVMTTITHEDGILLPVFVTKGTLVIVDSSQVFEFEDECWQHIVDVLTKAQDEIESNISIAKCRVRECKDVDNDNN